MRIVLDSKVKIVRSADQGTDQTKNYASKLRGKVKYVSKALGEFVHLAILIISYMTDHVG